MNETTRRTTKRTPNGGAAAAPATNRRRPDDGQAEVPVAEAKNGSRAAGTGSRAAEAKSGGRSIPRPAETPAPVLDREERIRMTAYFLAEQDGFRGEPESYWLAAERAVADSTNG